MQELNPDPAPDPDPPADAGACYTILSRAGWLQWRAGQSHAGQVHPGALTLRLNPGIASEAELASLRAAGVAVTVLPAAIDARAALTLSGPGVHWVEAAPPVQPVARRLPGRPPALDGLRHLARAGRLVAGAVRHATSRRQLMMLPYLGYGNAQRLWLQGRVLDERAFAQQAAADSAWRNLANLYRVLESDQVANCPVQASFAGRSFEAVTDAGGYFSFDIALDAAPPPGWLDVVLRLPATPGSSAVQASTRVLVPDAGAQFGVISDLDDTVLWTNVTNKLNMALLLARSNFHTRQAFKGVAAFYRALHDGVHAGEDGGASNPLFYVSNSPWHLYSSLQAFLELQGLPPGPLSLRQLGLGQLFGARAPANGKLERIEAIMAAYPALPFILIGDSGERDPEIYAELVRRHPARIKVIYIRNVNPDPARIAALDALIAEVAISGAQLVVAADSEAAASHAAAAGLIAVARLNEVRARQGAAPAAAAPSASAQPDGSR